MNEPEAALNREADMRALWDAQQWHRAATLILERYGAELISYLVAIARSETDGADAFSLLAEDVWRGLPKFRWQCSVRTWCYVLARHALARVRRAPHRQPGRAIALSDAPELALVAQQVRSTTIDNLRLEVKDEIAALREALDPDDQAMLILRIDRGLPWMDVARAMSGEDEELDDEGLRRSCAALRKRFERIKANLRAIVRAKT